MVLLMTSHLMKEKFCQKNYAFDEDQVNQFLESATGEDPNGVMSDAVLNDWIDNVSKRHPRLVIISLYLL